MSSSKNYYSSQKIEENFFVQKRIKKLRKMAGGDTYTIIYLKLLLKSQKTKGFLNFKGAECDFIAELAAEIDEKRENISITIAYLKKHEMLVKSEDGYFLTAYEGSGSNV